MTSVILCIAGLLIGGGVGILVGGLRSVDKVDSLERENDCFRLRLNRIARMETASASHTVRKMAAVARGEAF